MRSANRELQNEKFLPTLIFEPGTFRLRCELLSVALLEQIYIKHVKGDRILPVCVMEFTGSVYHEVDVVNVLSCNIVY